MKCINKHSAIFIKNIGTSFAYYMAQYYKYNKKAFK